MLLLHEKTLFQGEALEIALHDDLRYRLGFGELVLYENNFRRVRGKTSAYQFKSVEQLRYDFERDVRAAGGSLGQSS
jgi:hypothetical protein